MKRLIMVVMIFISGLIQTENGVASSPAPKTQSPSDDSSSIGIANVHQISLDTTEVDGGGNWLNKRIWYERSQTVFDEIRVMVNAVGDLRVQFSNEVNAVGQKIDSFFETVDFTKGQLDDKFKEILVALDTEKKMVGDLSEEERNLQTTIKQEIVAIDQIGTDIKSIGDVDNKIDQTLMQAFKTIDECRDYETKAWETFKSIGKELDDKKARNFYYQMNNYKQNIDQKISYLKSTLLPYLHNVLVAKVETNISKINKTIEQLKTKGIDLEKIMSKTQDDDVLGLKAREKAAAEIAVKKAVEIEQAKAKEAAEKAAQELEEANRKSFSNVMHHYYEATIGKIVGFVHQGYAATAIDSVHGFFTSYSYPIITYGSHAVGAVKIYMHDLVEHIMIYFGSKPAIKAEIKEKIEEKIEEKSKEKISGEHPSDVLKDKIIEKIAEHKDELVEHHDVKNSEFKQNHDHAAVALSEIKHLDIHHANLPTSPQVAIHALPTHSTSMAMSMSSSVKDAIEKVAAPATPSDKNVVVQSMKNDDDAQPNVNSFYTVFKTILDLVGTVLMSIYNCIAQLFKLLMSFSSYVTAGN